MTSEPGEWTKFRFTMQVYNFRANIQSLRLSEVSHQQLARPDSSSDDSPINLFNLKKSSTHNSDIESARIDENGSEAKTARDKEMIEPSDD